MIGFEGRMRNVCPIVPRRLDEEGIVGEVDGLGFRADLPGDGGKS